MFDRPAHTYRINFADLDPWRMMEDEANPIRNIVDLVPEGSRILDIGAGNGILGWLFSKVKPSVVCDGVERSTAGADVARPYYRKFYVADFQDAQHLFASEGYDFYVLADVIEHLVDPMALLGKIKEAMPTHAKIIVSVPNVAHYSVRMGLMNGKFQYVDSGLLERTHVRFFTLETIEEMFSRLRLGIEMLMFQNRVVDFTQPEKRIWLGWMSYLRLFYDRTALAYQFLFVLRSSARETTVVERGRVSLWKYIATVVVNRNGKCFSTIRRMTRKLRGAG